MRCNHCGACCKDPCVQVNLTIGDIHRISEFIKMPVEELFKEHIGINPFGDPDLIHYDMELGLNNPCKFRVDGKCSIYAARPLSCRLFPYWILAEAPLEKLRELLSEYGCSYDITKKKDYLKYKNILGEIVIEESSWFDPKRKVNITRLKGFKGIDEEDLRKREALKVELLKQWNKEKPPIEVVKKLILKHISEIKENAEKINKAEEIVN